MFVLYFTIILSLSLTITAHPHDSTYNNLVKEPTSSRILGGKYAPEHYAPHMVALLIGNEFVVMMCGGSIISVRHVLTAAHCIHAVLWWLTDDGVPILYPSLRGIIGSNKVTSTENVITFSNYINHPEWNQETFKNDVGILVTTQEIKFSDQVAAIPLKTSWVDGGEECYVTGWGVINKYFEIPERLQLLYVRTLGDQECIAAIDTISQILGGSPPPIDPQVEICTFHSPGHGMCNGDSGSALVSTRTREQIGIVAWGYPCAVGAPDVFVRISGVLDFLKTVLGEI